MKDVNLSVLQRQDKDVVSILDRAAHVVIYCFDQESEKWERRGVEGALFVATRQQAPLYRVYVLNRLSPDTFMEDLTAQFAVQMSKPYLMYRNHNQEINGIWFYEDAERERIGNLIQGLQKDQLDRHVQPQQPPPPQPQPQPQVSPAVQQIFQQAQQHQQAQQQQQVQQQPSPSTAEPAVDPGKALLGMLQTPKKDKKKQRQPQPAGQQPAQEQSDAVKNLFAAAAQAGAPLAGAPQSGGAVASKEEIRGALERLVHDPRFIDIVYAQYLQAAAKPK